MKKIFFLLFSLCILVPTMNVYSEDKKDTDNKSDLYPDIGIGSRLMFGSYPYAMDGSEKPIEWIVLDKFDDGTALLISRHLLDKAKYNYKQTKTTWAKCSLRSWLNFKFLKTAFNKKEIKAIKITNNVNSDNEKYKTKGGRNTKDKVFVLSIDEANKYFNDDSSRTAYATPYARRDTQYSGTAWHWLRSPGSEPDSAAEIGDIGEVDEIGYFVSRDGGAVRPAIRIYLEYFAKNK